MNRQSYFFSTRRYINGILVAGVIALLVAGIAGFYWFFPKSPMIITPISQPGATLFISKLAPAMVSLLVNPDQLEKWDRLGEVSQIKTNLLAKTHLNYRQDIQPWLGKEITLAVTTLDIDRDPDNGQQAGYLMVVATKQPEKSREFVELLFSQRAIAGANLTVEKYKGVKLLSDTASPDKVSELAAAVVGKYVLFANARHVLRAAINDVQAPGLNLLSAKKYQKASQQLPKNTLATAFLNLPLVSQWQGLPLSAVTYDRQLISLVSHPQGLLAETTLLSTSPVLPPSPPDAQPIAALNYIPGSTGLLIAGANLSNLNNSDLGKFWQQVTTTLYGSQEDATSRLIKPLIDIQQRWGMQLLPDIFSWVTGEYAIALLPSEEEINPHWVLIVEKTPQLAAGVERLNAIAKNHGFNISSLNLDEHKVTVWNELRPDTQTDKSWKVEAKIQGAYTSLDNYQIFTSHLETMHEILTNPNKSLNKNPQFQDSINAFPKTNIGYIYIDWKHNQQALEHQFPILKFVEIVSKPLFKNLRSLTVSSYGSDSGLLKGGIFFHHDF